MHLTIFTLITFLALLLKVSSSPLPPAQLPSQYHPLTPRQLLKTHKKNTPYCTPTTSKISDTNTCTYVWETFYNSQAVAGRRKWNTGVVYQGSGCVVLATDREALSYSLKTKSKPSRRAIARDNTLPVDNLIPLTQSDLSSNNPNQNPNPDLKSNTQTPNPTQLPNLDNESLAQNTSTIALTISGPKSSIPEDPSLHLPLYTFPLTFPIQKNAVAAGAKISALEIEGYLNTDTKTTSNSNTTSSSQPEIINPNPPNNSNTTLPTGMNTKAKPYPPPSTQYFPSQMKPLLRVSYEDTTGQGMLYEGNGVFPILELVRFTGASGDNDEGGNGKGMGKGERVGGGKEGCECSGGDGDESGDGVELEDFGTWVCGCGFECGGL